MNPLAEVIIGRDRYRSARGSWPRRKDAFSEFWWKGRRCRHHACPCWIQLPLFFAGRRGLPSAAYCNASSGPDQAV